jgi:hypothetical protein
MVISSKEIHPAHETAVSFRLAAAKYIGKPLPTQAIGTAAEIRRESLHARIPSTRKNLHAVHFALQCAERPWMTLCC